MGERKKTRICLVASGGGHLRQLLQLTPLIEQYDCYFVTERTPLGEAVASDHRARFVPHFAFGQRRLEGYPRFLWSGLKNGVTSLWHIAAERPQVIVSTGAGAAFFTMFLGWVFRRKVVYIESIARVKALSLFGRLVSRFAGLFIVQWPGLAGAVPGARYCDSIRVSNEEPPHKKDQVLVTIGTFVPFDRLVSAVADLKKSGAIQSQVIAQVGDSKLTFEGIETFPSCSYDEMNQLMKESALVICHGGSGSILGALKAGCRVVAMPRKPEFGEVYDDHQVELIEALAERGLIGAAASEDDLQAAIDEVSLTPGRRAEVDPTAITDEILNFLN